MRSLVNIGPLPFFDTHTARSKRAGGTCRELHGDWAQHSVLSAERAWRQSNVTAWTWSWNLLHGHGLHHRRPTSWLAFSVVSSVISDIPDVSALLVPLNSIFESLSGETGVI